MQTEIIDARLNILPHSVWKIISSYGWLVGSGAEYLIGKKGLTDCNDWDIIVELHDWRKLQNHLSADSIKFEVSYQDLKEVNNFGGYRFKLNNKDRDIDIWPQNLGNYLKTVPDHKPRLAINISPPIICKGNYE